VAVHSSEAVAAMAYLVGITLIIQFRACPIPNFCCRFTASIFVVVNVRAVD
jgi:hypothetical protein